MKRELGVALESLVLRHCPLLIPQRFIGRAKAPATILHPSRLLTLGARSLVLELLTLPALTQLVH